MKKVLVLAGAPGSGKGSLSVELQGYLYEKLGIPHTVIETKTFLKEDERFNQIIASGGLVDDEEVIRIIEKPLYNCEDELIILDGFPRTIRQAEWLEKAKDLKVCVLKLEANYEEIIERVKNRRVCKVCGKTHNLKNEKIMPRIEGICNYCGGKLEIRPDDAKIAKRLATYDKETEPAIQDLIDKGVELHRVDSNKIFEKGYVENLVNNLNIS